MSGVEPVFRALADRRRRTALACLRRRRAVSLAALAEEVAAAERNEGVTEVSDERVREVYLSLRHKHVPVLADAGLVRHDRDDDLVGRTARATALLERARDRVESLIGTR